MENKETHPGLLRALGPFTATAIVAGTVIGSGVFKKPQSIAANVPGFDLIAMVWILGGVLALLGALTLAEVTVLFPAQPGGTMYSLPRRLRPAGSVSPGAGWNSGSSGPLPSPRRWRRCIYSDRCTIF